MAEEGKPGSEQDPAERELEALRRAIEESRVRRRRANEAFDQFLKGFDQGQRRETPPPAVVAPRPSAPPSPPPAAATPVPAPAPPPVATAAPPPAVATPPVTPEAASPAPVVSTAPTVRPMPPVPPRPSVPPAKDGLDLARTDEALLASPPPSTSWQPEPIEVSPSGYSASLADFEEEKAGASVRSPLPSIPAALAPPSPQRRNNRLPAIAAVAAVVILATIFLVRGRSSDDGTSDVTQSAPAAAQPAPAPAPAAAPVVSAPPAAEISTSRRVWLRVTVDGERVVEREVDANTKIPLTPTSQIVVRAGDASAVRVALAGKDQGPLGPAGQVVTRSFVLKPGSRATGEPAK